MTGLVERHDHDGGAVTAQQPCLPDERLLALLERNRVHDRLALHAFQPGLDHRKFRGIDHDRDAGDVGLRGDEIEKRRHRLLGIEQAFVHVHVENLRAVLDLIARHGERGGIVAGGDELAEARRAGDVGAFADIHERNRRRQREGFEAGETEPLRDRRNPAWRLAGDRGGDGADMVRRRAATSADDVDDAGSGEFADLRRHGGRALVVMAEFVGQSGIGVGADQRVGDARQFGDVRPHLAGAERAIETDRQRRGVGDRIPERFRRLSSEQPPGPVGDRARDHHRQLQAAFLHDFGTGENRRLGVERVEDGFDQQHVDAAVDQSAHLLGVGAAQFVERDGAKTGVQNVWRNRRGAVGRTDGAGDEAGATVLILHGLRGAARKLRTLEVQFVGDLSHAVIGLCDPGR